MSTAQPAQMMTFDDNSLLAHLVGEHDQHLDRIERRLGVRLIARGNQVSIDGPASSVEQARIVLSTLYDRLRRGLEVDQGEIDAVLRIAPSRHADTRAPEVPLPPLLNEPTPLRTRKRQITARAVTQRS